MTDTETRADFLSSDGDVAEDIMYRRRAVASSVRLALDCEAGYDDMPLPAIDPPVKSVDHLCERFGRELLTLRVPGVISVHDDGFTITAIVENKESSLCPVVVATDAQELAVAA